MTERVDVAVIGGGHCGMSTSYLLTQKGIDHVVLDRSVPFHRWKNERWDSFTMQTPQWMNYLPGYPYWGDDPDALISRKQIIEYLDAYLDLFHPPLRAGVEVTRVGPDPSGEGYVLQTTSGEIRAKNVVLALGAYQKLKVPDFASEIPDYVLQVPSTEYKNPQQLPPGGVIVVGTGQSGCQIAEDLAGGGRATYLSVGKCGGMPLNYCGHPMSWWTRTMGRNDRTVDQLSPEERVKALNSCNPHSDKRKGSDYYLRRLAADGVTMLGRLEGMKGGSLVMGPDLDRNVAMAEAFGEPAKKLIDDYMIKNGLGDPEKLRGNWSQDLAPVPLQSTFEMDLRTENIGAIVWAVGFRVDVPWLLVPVMDETGNPVHQRGVTEFPGLYFAGLRWQYKANSSTMYGSSEDSGYVVDHIAQRLGV